MGAAGPHEALGLPANALAASAVPMLPSSTHQLPAASYQLNLQPAGWSSPIGLNTVSTGVGLASGLPVSATGAAPTAIPDAAQVAAALAARTGSDRAALAFEATAMEASGELPAAGGVQPPSPHLSAFCREVLELLEAGGKSKTSKAPREIGAKLRELTDAAVPPHGLETAWRDPRERKGTFFITRGNPGDSRKNAGGSSSGIKPKPCGGGVFCTMAYAKRCCVCRATYKHETCKAHSCWPYEVYTLAYDQPPAAEGYEEKSFYRGKMKLWVPAGGPGYVGWYVKPREAPTAADAGPEAAGTASGEVPAATAAFAPAEVTAAGAAAATATATAAAAVGAVARLSTALGGGGLWEAEGEEGQAAAAGAMGQSFTALLLSEDVVAPHGGGLGSGAAAADADTSTSSITQGTASASVPLAAKRQRTGPVDDPSQPPPPPLGESFRELFAFLDHCALFGSPEAPATHRDAASLLRAWAELLARVGAGNLMAMRRPENGQCLAHWLATPPSHLYDERRVAPPTDPDAPLPEALAVSLMQAAIDFLHVRRWRQLLQVRDSRSRATPLHRACRFGHRKRSLVLESDHIWLPYHTAFRSGVLQYEAGVAHLRKLVSLTAELAAASAADNSEGSSDDSDDGDAATAGPSGGAAQPLRQQRYGDDGGGGGDGDSVGRRRERILSQLVYSLPNKFFNGFDEQGNPVPGVSAPFGRDLLFEACRQLGLPQPAEIAKKWKLVPKGKALARLERRAKRLDREEEDAQRAQQRSG